MPGRSPWPFALCLPLTILVYSGLGYALTDEGATDSSELDHFENRIRPLFAEKCFKCHGPKKQKGGLRLDTPEGILAGGEGGPVVVAGDLEGSRMIQAVHYSDEDLQMPPRTKLDAGAIADLERWVSRGLALPAHGAVTRSEAFDLEERLQHWSFQAIGSPTPPPVENTDWPRDDVDRYLLARMEREGIEPAPDAGRVPWIRRVTFDLVGLPPSPEEVRAFLEDESADAKAQVVDRLLASPHFGERWGRHWLDLVRFAETLGHEFDYPIPNAWQYRDYVVRAFNADVPYDRFVREHVAGDLLETPRPNPDQGYDESILGTGFWFLGEATHSPVDIREEEADRVANQIDVFSRAFLGLTVACARCHDHKFDPLSTEDFYALSGFAMGGSYRQARFETIAQEGKTAGLLKTLQDRHRPRIRETLAQALAQELDHLPARMGAAREFINAAPGALGDLEPSLRASLLMELTDRYGLNEEELVAWVEETQEARKRTEHPLHARVLSAESTPEVPNEDGVAERPEDKAYLAALFGTDAAGEPTLLQDGHCAGPGALTAGTLLLSDDPVRPAIGLLDRDAIHFDPFWDRTTLDPVNQAEPNATKGILPGRMFRSPTLEVRGDGFAVLVRGQGFVYAAVDSHRTVQGPLHTALCKNIDTGGLFQWIKLDLSDYVGHRLHLEFSPRQGSSMPLAVAGFRQGAPDRDSVEPPGIDFEGARSRVLERNGGDRADRALVDWILQHPALFPLEHPDYLAAGSSYLRDLKTLAASQTWSSHTAPVMLEGSGVDEFVLLRGNADSPGHVASRRFLQALGGKLAPPITVGSGRLELAVRLTSEENPFISRVWVNRIWHHLFGRGLVPTVDDFGVMGEPPSHPDLLDHLARVLIADTWSTKAMIRRLVLSRTYGMSSQTNPRARELDPNNRLAHRMPVKRLDAESLRDAIMTVSGTLDRQLFGLSIQVHLTPFLDGRGKPSKSGPIDGAGRRSLYLSVRRNFPEPFLKMFDFPTPATTIGRRSNSNVPTQALTLLNDPMVHGEARRWATRLLEDQGGLSAEERVTELYLRALARPPLPDESEAALAFVVGHSKPEGNDADAWTALCHVIYNLKEFRYLQ